MSLTDDWKAEKLKDGWYYTLITNDEITPNLWFDDEWDDFRGNVVEVLAPCDYEELQRLKEENADLQVGADSLRELNKIMRRNYDKKVDSLRELLRECLAHLSFGEIGTSVTPINELVSHINAAIGESEE